MKKIVLASLLVLGGMAREAKADMFGGDGVPRMARV